MSKSVSGSFIWASVLLLAAVLLPSAFAQADFTVIVLPDTQFYSAKYPQIFNAQTQWIVNNRDALNIQLVVGVGDIVDGPTQVSQWQNADAAVRLLDGKVPYVLAIGNHDYDNFNPGARQTTNFNQWFGPSRYTGYPWYGASNFPTGSNENFYATVNLGGTDYLILALEYIPRQAALDWADGVLKANATKPVILVTHSYMYTDNTTTDQCDTADNTTKTQTNGVDGQRMWRTFVSQYPNIKMVLSGHVLGVGQRSDFGVNGNLVNQMLVDYQGMTNGGNGYLRILTFQPSQNQVQIQTFSPYLNSSFTDAANQFTWQLSGAPPIALDGTVKGKVRRGRIGVVEDCDAVPGALVADSDNSVSADESGGFSLRVPPGSQTVTAADEGFLTTTDQMPVTPGVINDEPLFLFPNQYLATLCDVSGAADHSITFCSPTSTLVTSPVHVQLQAKLDQGFVNLLQLYVDGVSTITTNSTQLDGSVSLAAGTHHLLGRGRDDKGVVFSNSMDVSIPAPSACDVSSAPTPSVTICTPQNNATVSSPLQIIAQGKDSQAIKRTQLYLDGTLKFTANSSQLNTSIPVTPGSHRISVVSTNVGSGTTKATISVNVPMADVCDTSGAATPSVTICSPAPNANVTSPVQITAQSKDSQTITRMQLYVDGAQKLTVKANQLNTSYALTSGPHRLTVTATDSGGVTTKASINVTAQ